MQPESNYANYSDIDISSLWESVARNKMFLLLAVLSIGILTVLLLSIVTPQYQSVAKILIEREKSLTSRSMTNKNSVSPDRIDKEAVVSQVQVLNSRDLADDVVEKLGLIKRPEFNPELAGMGFFGKLLGILDFLGSGNQLTEEERVLNAFQQGLTVYQVPNSRVIAVGFTAIDADIAAQAANTLADSYLEWQHGRRVSENLDASIWLGRKINEMRAEVQKAEARLESFRVRAGFVKGQNNVTLNEQQLSELSSRLTLATAQMSEAEARAKSIRKMMERGTVETASDVIKSPLIQRLLEQRVTVQRHFSELSATFLPAHPRMRQLQSELIGVDNQIRTEARKIARGLENEAKIAGAREASLRMSLEGIRSMTEKSSNDQAQLRILEREAKSKRDLYEAYVARHDDTSSRSDASALPIYARIFQRARPSSLPYFPRKGPITLLVMVATLLLGLAGIVTRALLLGPRVIPTVQNAHSSQKLDNAHGYGESSWDGGLSVATPKVNSDLLTSTDSVSKGGSANKCALRGPKHPFTSLVTLARSLADSAQSMPGHRTLVIESELFRGAGGIGLELGEQLGQLNKRVMVAEWDTLEGDGSSYEVATVEPGLLDVVAGTASFEDAIKGVLGSPINKIALGTRCVQMDPHDETKRLNLALDALDQTYDHVIIRTTRVAARELLRKIGNHVEACVIVGHDITSELGDGVLFEELVRSLPKDDVLHYVGGSARHTHQTLDGERAGSGLEVVG